VRPKESGTVSSGGNGNSRVEGAAQLGFDPVPGTDETAGHNDPDRVDGDGTG